ncbi:MAG: hypothetical protein M9894_12820 [Planctomycetes bacterium]|nr:hypothetical protein [Planctomycetota bacterium]
MRPFDRLAAWLRGATRGVAAAARDAASLAGVALGAALDLRRDQAALLAENALLRQQLAAAVRQLERARPSRLERLSLALLGRAVDWRARGALLLVTPDTLVRWQRAGWSLLWRWRSRPRRRGAAAAPGRDARGDRAHEPREPALGREAGPR